MPGQIHGYKIVDSRRGGMGIVYKGVDQSGFARAFKVLNPEKAADNPRLCEKFANGIRIMAKLQHPHIVRASGAFTNCDDETGAVGTVLEMDWLDGEDLDTYVRSHAPNGLPAAVVTEIGVQVCDAMAYAHSQNILHLDIKPGNLIRSPQGFVWVIDFGIARIIGENARMVEGGTKYATVTTTGESTFRGTVAFASPEQFNGGRVDRRSDIYSFGCTLHYLLTGSTEPAVKVKDPHLARVVKRCLEHDPDDRYQNFSEVKAALTTKEAEKMARCSQCGKEIASGLNFCPYCGSKIEQAKPEKKTCPECGLVQDRETLYCPVCGHDFRSGNVQPAQPVNKQRLQEKQQQMSPPTLSNMADIVKSESNHSPQMPVSEDAMDLSVSYAKPLMTKAGIAALIILFCGLFILNDYFTFGAGHENKVIKWWLMVLLCVGLYPLLTWLKKCFNVKSPNFHLCASAIVFTFSEAWSMDVAYPYPLLLSGIVVVMLVSLFKRPAAIIAGKFERNFCIIMALLYFISEHVFVSTYGIGFHPYRYFMVWGAIIIFVIFSIAIERQMRRVRKVNNVTSDTKM